MSKKQVANVVILDKNDHFLIIKRTKTAPTHPLHWDLPGGHVEKGESNEEAAIREALEETNLIISDLQDVKVPDSFRNFFITKKYSGNIEFKENPESGFVEHNDFKWVPIEDYKKLENLSIKPEEIEIVMRNQSKKALFEQNYQLRVDMLLMEGRKDDVFKKYSYLGKSTLDSLAFNDQDNNYKHLNWMAKQLVKIPDWEAYSHYGKEQEARVIIDAVKKFIEYKPRLKKKDINQYKNVAEIYSDIDEYIIKPQIAKSVKKRKDNPRTQQFLDAGEGTIVYEDDRYFVVRPDTMSSSCYFGKKTNWCIAQEPNSYFDQYTNSDRKAFYFIKDEGLRSGDLFRKMAVQIGYDTGEPLFEMFWDRDDDPYETYHTNDWEEAAEHLSSESKIPLQISENIMKAIFTHAEENPPKNNAMIRLAQRVDDENEFDTNYISFYSNYDEYSHDVLSMMPMGEVNIEIPIKNKALLSMLSTPQLDWEGDEYDFKETIEERFEDIFKGSIQEFTDMSTGEEQDVDQSPDMPGPYGDSNFFENTFDSSAGYDEVRLRIETSKKKMIFSFRIFYGELGYGEPEYVADASDAEDFFLQEKKNFTIPNIVKTGLEEQIYSLIPEVVSSDIDQIINKLHDANKESKNIKIEEIEVNKYYNNIKLYTIFPNITAHLPDDKYESINLSYTWWIRTEEQIKNIVKDALKEIWDFSKKSAKSQIKLDFDEKYNEKGVDDLSMPDFNINIKPFHHTAGLPRPQAQTKINIKISTLIKFIDTSEEMLAVYNFFKFIDERYTKLFTILEKNIYTYVKNALSGAPQPIAIEEAKKCWPGYEKKGTKKMFGKTVNNCVKKEEVEIVDEAEGKKDACYHKVKSRYKVWPSAYASGALVKCRKVGAKNWGNSKKESLRIIIEDEISQVLLENQDDDSLEKAIMKALKDEGGAAGLDALEKHTDATEEEIKSIIKKSEKIQTHRDDDIIDMSGLEEGYIKDYAKHSALNLGQVLRHLKYLTDLPGTNNKLEATKKRLRYIINDLYYTVTPGQWHHSQEELDELSKYKYKDLLKMGFDPDFADKMLSVSPEIEMQEAIIEEIIEQETERYLTEKKKKAGTESSKESSLKDWFGRKGAKGSKKGWVDCNSPDGKGGYKACGRSSGEKRKKYPACRPTPGACKEKGKGKSWGKKAKKSKKGK